MKVSEDQFENAGIIDPVDDSTIYYCFPEPGTSSEAETKWGICRAKKFGTAWHYQWAEGTTEKKFQASKRTELNYSWPK